MTQRKSDPFDPDMRIDPTHPDVQITWSNIGRLERAGQEVLKVLRKTAT